MDDKEKNEEDEQINDDEYVASDEAPVNNEESAENETKNEDEPADSPKNEDENSDETEAEQNYTDPLPKRESLVQDDEYTPESNATQDPVSNYYNEKSNAIQNNKDENRSLAAFSTNSLPISKREAQPEIIKPQQSNRERWKEIKLHAEHDLMCCDKILKIIEPLYQLQCFKDHKIKESYYYLTETTKQLKEEVTDQIERVRKQAFEIAIVGREKAGKSSLLNAWLGKQLDLLPSERGRCTYTVTELRSCPNDDSQCFEIHYFDKEEFYKRYNLIREMANSTGSGRDRQLYEEELKEIEQYLVQIQSYCGRGIETRSFKNFNFVRDELKEAISKPQRARAVKKVVIYTPALSTTDDLIFWDVPGYDSPITLHKEQTRTKIASVDAVLYAKNFAQPDLVDCEHEILKITDSSNVFVKTSDKIVVALTQCDTANTPSDFNSLLKSARINWSRQGVLWQRVIPCCAGAELDIGDVGMTCKKRLKDLNVGIKYDKAKAKKKLQDFQNIDQNIEIDPKDDDDTVETVIQTTGFNELKDAVNCLVYNARTTIVETRLSNSKKKLLQLVGKFINFVYDECKLSFEDTQADIINAELDAAATEWWLKEWKLIEEDFQTFYQANVRTKLPIYQLYQAQANEVKEADVVGFKQLYDDTIERNYNTTDASKKERQKAIFIKCTGDEGIVSPKEGNAAIRIELTREAIATLDKITVEFTNFLIEYIEKIIEWITKRLWGIPEIKKEMYPFPCDIYDKFLKKSFDSLFLRLCKPAIDLFLRYPRSKIERLRVMHEYQMEMVILDCYFTDGRLIKRYLDAACLKFLKIKLYYLFFRGIVNYLASGELGEFDLEVNYDQLVGYSKEPEKYRRNIDEDDGDDIKKKKKRNQSDDDVGENDENDEGEKKKKRKKGKKEKKEKKEHKHKHKHKHKSRSKSNHKDKDDEKDKVKDKYKVEEIDEDLIKGDEKYTVKLIKFHNHQFSGLKFSNDAGDLPSIEAEIEQDFSEFLFCLKNSVFYGSGILRFFNQELDSFRRRFLELENNRRTWYLLGDYILTIFKNYIVHC